jgi:hypothetical protein
VFCTLCNANYAFNYSTTNCVLCNASTQTILNNTCFSGVQNCQQYQMSFTPGTLVCTQCNAIYASTYNTKNCIQCNNSTQVILNNTCYTAVPNCQQYQMSSTPGTLVCTLCNTNYAFNYSTTNCIQCNNSTQTILNNVCFTNVQNCQQYQISFTNPGILVCTLCSTNYAFNYSSTNCVICNAANQTILNNICFTGVQNCQQYEMNSTPGTLVCT